MRAAFSISMIIAIMLPSLLKFGILVDFKINQEYIAKVLCINKDEPMSGCNGKCHLSKQLENAEEPEEKQAPRTSNLKLENIYLIDKLSYYKSNPCLAREFKAAISLYLLNFLPSLYISEIFHPPK